MTQGIQPSWTLFQSRLSGVQRLARECRVARLELLGSVARREQAHDYDFLVSFLLLPPLEHGRAYFRLWESLQDLLAAPVDLVEAEAASPTFLTATAPERSPVYAYDA